MKIVKNQRMDEERALYNLQNARVSNCRFEGPLDGESALKEGRNLEIDRCVFALRYPLWHVQNCTVSDCILEEGCRAPAWYVQNGTFVNTLVEGVKCLRECTQVQFESCKVHSPEFGWRCKDVRLTDSEFISEYFLFESRDVVLNRVRMKGKYSFQYVENMVIEDSILDTKDAFWHAKNVMVKNSTVKGEYLGWYSEGLTLINCRIIGTQPLCYCKNLTLQNCTMEETDLSFEYSEVNADVQGSILSVKNPKSGRIVADSYGEIILERPVYENSCSILTRTQA